MSNPKVSIVMIAFNPDWRFGRALGSVIDQTEKDFEVIVVDDGSNVPVDLQMLVGRDPRFTMIRHASNKGRGAARDTGLKAAQGDYVAFLDADDWWLSTKLSSQIALFESNNQIMACSTPIYAVDDDGEILGIQPPVASSSHPYSATRLPFASSMIRTSFARTSGFDRGLRDCEDLDFLMGLEIPAGAAFVASEPTYVYHSPEAQFSTRVRSSIGPRARIVCRHLRSRPRESLRLLLRTAASCVAGVAGLGLAEKHRLRPALEAEKHLYQVELKRRRREALRDPTSTGQT